MNPILEPATIAVRASLETDSQYGAVIPPLHLSSNNTFAGLGEKREYDYCRSGNPTRSALARALTELEGGAGGVVTSSGMAAINLVLQLVSPGQRVLAPHDCYGGTYRLLTQLAAKGHFEVLFADLSDTDRCREAFRWQPDLVLLETPSNPLLRITDIGRVVALAAGCGALVAVDNTFLSPALQRPLDLGADFVVHSTTKYLNGHSDVIGGAVVAASEELSEKLDGWANCLGVSGAPFDSYQTLRGLRTLFARIEQHERNAGRVARMLAAHASVRHVYYPGLPAHPGHDLACRQQRGFGGMLSFELDGDEAMMRLFLDGLRRFSLAESLGGVESLVCHPASMTHAAMSPDAREKAGIGDGLVRLSVGIENGDDLLADIAGAFDHARRNSRAVRWAG